MGSPRPSISPVEPDILVFNCMCHFSSGMLEEAKKKDAYRDFSLCDLNKDNLEKYYKQFDHAISIGCFVLGICYQKP